MKKINLFNSTNVDDISFYVSDTYFKGNLNKWLLDRDNSIRIIICYNNESLNLNDSMFYTEERTLHIIKFNTNIIFKSLMDVFMTCLANKSSLPFKKLYNYIFINRKYITTKFTINYKGSVVCYWNTNKDITKVINKEYISILSNYDRKLKFLAIMDLIKRICYGQQFAEIRSAYKSAQQNSGVEIFSLS